MIDLIQFSRSKFLSHSSHIPEENVSKKYRKCTKKVPKKYQKSIKMYQKVKKNIKSDPKQCIKKVVLTIIEATTISIFHDQATGFLDGSTKQLNNVRMMNSGKGFNFFRKCCYLILSMDLFHCNRYILPLSTTNQSKGSLSQDTLCKRLG